MANIGMGCECYSTTEFLNEQTNKTNIQESGSMTVICEEGPYEDRAAMSSIASQDNMSQAPQLQ